MKKPKENKMTKTITSKSMLGTPVEVTFEDNFDYIYWGNDVTEEHKLDKLPKTDAAYKVLNEFKDALSVMATSRNNYENCVIYTRKSTRCKTWSASFCSLS